MYLILKKVAFAVGGLFLPAVLFISGLFFLFKIGGAVFSPRFLRRVLAREKMGDKELHLRSDTKRKGVKNNTSSSFSSLCLALAGTLGVGNISGVTAAIMIGGPGTVFWIWVSAIVASVLKYAETVLAIHYRARDGSGEPCGGAHLYIKKGLNAPVVANLFCIICVITSFFMGCITQTRAAADGVYVSSGISPVICGIAFFAIVLYLSLGGGDRISRLTLRLIPPLCLVYICLSLAVIFIFRENIFYVTKMILTDAFSPKAGVLGFLFSPAMRYGVTRGIMSNEAGCGTAPMAYAKAESVSPARQGIYGIAEVLCDTLLLCTLTAYTVLLSETALSGGATEVAINSFASALGNGVKPLLGVSVFLFALGSVAGWSFYGQESLKALGQGRKFLKIYGVLYALSAFLGCVMPENAVWELADLSISLMAIINVGAVLLLSRDVVKITKGFSKNGKENGKMGVCGKKRRESKKDDYEKGVRRGKEKGENGKKNGSVIL